MDIYSTYVVFVLNRSQNKGLFNTQVPCEKCAFLVYNAACSGYPLPKFRNNLSVPSSRVKNPRSSLNMGQICCPETSERNYHYSLRNSPEDHSSRLLHGGRMKAHKSFVLRLRNACNITLMNGPGGIFVRKAERMDS
jgi:hypothetical protein